MGAALRRFLFSRKMAWLLVVMGLAGLVAPLCWPPPRVAVQAPARAPFNRDVPLTLDVSAWHGNVVIVGAYLALARPPSRSAGVSAGAYPVALLASVSPPRTWDGVDWTTCPRHMRTACPLPLRDLARRGIVTPGPLRGTAHIMVAFPHLNPDIEIGPYVDVVIREITAPVNITLTAR